ncbi:MAG: hypothetical protein CMG61_00380 [Candidatus Marinimicrobia bacterium]|nr:hypothetical protein [Candidatus Neomarinimicrobiota bacterium]|tara:strand:- start:18 stop:455 length:438 start_codon:yes stop_codon:yes gene_type:complete
MNAKKNMIILSGGFDPIHKGHIRMFKEASLNGMVVAGLNSDEWLIRKKGKFFMPFVERKEILESIKYIDLVKSFDDSDDTACNLIHKIDIEFSDKYNIFFGNGGDRTNQTTPEIKFCNDNNIDLIWGLGGGKIQSSSDLLKNWYK